jgi:hypothetical protein
MQRSLDSALTFKNSSTSHESDDIFPNEIPQLPLSVGLPIFSNNLTVSTTKRFIAREYRTSTSDDLSEDSSIAGTPTPRSCLSPKIMSPNASISSRKDLFTNKHRLRDRTLSSDSTFERQSLDKDEPDINDQVDQSF